MAETQEQVLEEPSVPHHSTSESDDDSFDLEGSPNSRETPSIVRLPRRGLISGRLPWKLRLRDPPDSTSAGNGTVKESKENYTTKFVWEEYQKKIADLPETEAENRPITIFSLPRYICETNEAMHIPKLVSIGPYHNEAYNSGPYHNEAYNKSLRTLQEHKWRCARDFLDAHDMDPHECIRKIAANEQRARLCYSEKVKLQSKEFIRMLLLDGCFILEFLRKRHGHVHDSFFNIERNWATILTDILLVQNQIPYFIIHELFNLANANTSCSEDSCMLRDLIFNLFPTQILWTKPQISCESIYHLLHLYYLSMVPDACSRHQVTQSPSRKNKKVRDKITIGRLQLDNAPKPRKNNTGKDKPWVIPSVTELTEAGVSFRRNTNPRHLFDIIFKDGVMEIPALFIDDLNCILLTNLLAFEQICYGPKEIISNFVRLFDSLIDTKKDVSLLEGSNVLINMFESEEEIASFFNQLGRWNLVEPREEYSMLIRHVQEYYTSFWPRCRAIWIRDYFTIAWTTISVIAANILLGLTVVQTYYTVYSSIHQ